VTADLDRESHGVVPPVNPGEVQQHQHVAAGIQQRQPARHGRRRDPGVGRRRRLEGDRLAQAVGGERGGGAGGEIHEHRPGTDQRHRPHVFGGCGEFTVQGGLGAFESA
jgi:hypothetical protein